MGSLALYLQDLPSLAISIGDTTPAGDRAGQLAYSSTLGMIVVWNGTSWQPDGVQGFKVGVTGKTLASEKYPTTAEYAFTIAASRCTAKAGTAATASTVFTVKKNGTSIGTITFAAGATSGTFSFSNTAIAAGDFITIEGPGTPDATLADIAFTIRN
jgi:hypothetical protein